MEEKARVMKVDDWSEEWEEQLHPPDARELELVVNVMPSYFAEDLSLRFKTMGNEHFAAKRFGHAVSTYTAALFLKTSNSLVNAQLLTNRATSQFYLGNYRMGL